MKFVKIDRIPERREKASKKPTREMLEEFLSADIKYASVVLEEGDYCRTESARCSLVNTINMCDYPIKVETRRGELFLVRMDI